MEENFKQFILVLNVLTQLGIIGGVVRWIKTQQAQKDSLKCLLRAHIIQNCCKAQEREWIKMYEYENLTEMFELYTKLGGNGTVKNLYEQTMKLKHYPPHDKEGEE